MPHGGAGKEIIKGHRMPVYASKLVKQLSYF